MAFRSAEIVLIWGLYAFFAYRLQFIAAAQENVGRSMGGSDRIAIFPRLHYFEITISRERGGQELSSGI